MDKEWYPDNIAEFAPPPCIKRRGPSYAQGNQLPSACCVREGSLEVAYVHTRSMRPTTAAAQEFLKAACERFLSNPSHARGTADPAQPVAGFEMCPEELLKHNYELKAVRLLFIAHMAGVCRRVLDAASPLLDGDVIDGSCVVRSVIVAFTDFLKDIMEERAHEDDDPFWPLWHESHMMSMGDASKSAFQMFMWIIARFKTYTTEFVMARTRYTNRILAQCAKRTPEHTRAFMDALLVAWEMCGIMPLFMDALYLQTVHGEDSGCVMAETERKAARRTKRFAPATTSKRMRRVKAELAIC